MKGATWDAYTCRMSRDTSYALNLFRALLVSTPDKMFLDS